MDFNLSKSNKFYSNYFHYLYLLLQEIIIEFNIKINFYYLNLHNIIKDLVIKL